MKQTGIRTYEIEVDDFPLNIVVRARSLGTCDVVVSDVHVVSGGVLVAQTPVIVASDQAALSKTYDIKKPSQKAGCDLVQTISGWFGNRVLDNAKYEITITSTLGDTFKTSIGVPTINPGIANLTLQFR